MSYNEYNVFKLAIWEGKSNFSAGNFPIWKYQEQIIIFKFCI